MDCQQARRLISEATGQASLKAHHAELSSHLRTCPACRAYQRSADTTLLADLLAAAPSAPALLADLLAAAPAAAPQPPGAGPASARPARRPWLRYSLVAVLSLGALWLGLIAGRLAYAAYTISSSIQAMQIQPTPRLSLPAGPVELVASATPAELATAAPAGIPPRPTVATGAEPPPPAPSSTEVSGFPATYQPSATPIRLPALSGPPLPTLMPTAGVVVPSGDALNILVLGSDRRPGESWATRSDAIMVVRLDPQRQRVALLSLPRDLIVPIPGYGQARINAATVYGDTYPELGGGIELARRTVGGYLGLSIDHVIRADFSAFTSAIDAIGGVDIYVDEPLYDPQYPTMDYGYMEVYFPAGMQHMDGATALIYSRIRHADSNYARNRRQQQVILAIVDKVRQENLLGQAELLSDLSVAISDDIQTDLPIDAMLGIAWQFRSVLPHNVERYALDETMVSEGVLADDPYATYALPGAVERLVSQFLGAGSGS